MSSEQWAELVKESERLPLRLSDQQRNTIAETAAYLTAIEAQNDQLKAENALLTQQRDALKATCEKTLSFWERYIDRVGPSESWAVAVRNALRAAIEKAQP